MKIKNIFDENTNNKKDGKERKGFYIAVVVCLAVIIAAAAIALGGNARNESEKEQEDNNTDITNPINSEDSENVNELSDLDNQETFIGEEIDNSDNENTIDSSVDENSSESTVNTPDQDIGDAISVTADPEDDFAIDYPVDGEITFDYSMDQLVFSTTLQEWRTHSGIDIAGSRGDPVKAAADGVVSEVKNDPRFGATIVIDHLNGYKTVYSNLVSFDMVNPNQKIEAGEVIGAIGNTALYECAEQAHVHFEVIKNDHVIDPKEVLKD